METRALPVTNYRALRSLVAESLRAGIQNGTLRPGARLSEAALAAELEVSRSPVREALRELEKEGLVRSSPNRGVEVVTLTADDLHEIYAIRCVLEALASREAVARATDADVADLRQLIEQMHESASVGAGRAAFVPLDISFHRRVRRIARNERLEAILAGLQAQVRLSLSVAAAADPDPAGQRVKELVREHSGIFDAIAARDARRAEALTVRHIENGRERLLVRFKSAGQPADGAGAPPSDGSDRFGRGEWPRAGAALGRRARR